MTSYAAEAFFDLGEFAHRDLFAGQSFVWQGLAALKAYMDVETYQELPAWLPRAVPLPETVICLDGLCLQAKGAVIDYGDATKGKLVVIKDGQQLPGASVIMAGTVLVGERFQIGRGVLVESGAFLQAPVVLGDNTVVRQGAYLRGYCLVGRRCVVGHVTEVKHAIFLDDAKAGHFAYLGDSILGNGVNLGAGTKLANLRFVGGGVQVKTAAGPMPTGLRKMGAILGDRVQTGCNSVTNPGTLMGKDSLVLPCVTVSSGYHPAHSVIRS
jgi:bifunctional N-acetylglucosamine-1-phosphate-uridyltransferase/glucosamine-1-phosphate-acetyltransferase GlmU-like protein